MAAALVIAFSGTPASGAAAYHQPAAEKAAPETCSARKAVKFYSSRLNFWARKMGRDTKIVSSHHRCGSYLAHVLQRKAYAARVAYEKWWKARGQVISRLNRGLAGTPMSATGIILERWGRRYHVSPYFMAAVAATESSLGRAACSNNRFNVWGLSSCGSGWYVPPFRSWDEAIAFYAHFLSSRWPGHSTPYSFQGYAACSPCWGAKTSYWMRSLFGVPAVTRYP